MNRSVLLLALVMMLAVSGLAMAQEYHRQGAPLPTNAQPVEGVMEWNGTKWVSTSNAKAYNSGSFSQGHCNRECWDFTLETHVSVAQWIDWEVNASRKDWRVLKPGTYAGDSIAMKVRSNNDVRLTYWAEPAEYLGEEESPPIETGFGLVKGRFNSIDPNMVGGLDDFAMGSEFSESEPFELTLPYEDVRGSGETWRIYDVIVVTDEHRSSDYHGTSFFNICVTNLKHWVDPETGGFAEAFNKSVGYPSNWADFGY